MTTRIVGLIDCDSFFASCEKVFRPDWANRPIVVLSNNDGCVVARSAEAKALQIPMGEPYFRIRSFAESHGVIVRSANFALYGDLSRRVVQTLSRWTDSIDVYSIDEAFLDLTNLFLDARGRFLGLDDDPLDGRSLGDVPRQTREKLERLAQEITTTVRRWTGIPVSLGLAPNRTLAKAASRLAKDEANVTGKKYALLFGRGERVAGLRRLDVGKIWGVGRRLSAKFDKAGVHTAFDLAKLDPKFMRESISIVQEKLVRELRGEFMYDVEPPEPQKSLQISRSFGETIESLDELRKPVATFAAKAAAKMRARGIVASGLYVYITTNRHNEKAPQRNVGAAFNFSKPTNLTPEIMNVALRLLEKIYAPGYAYKKAGVLALETIEQTEAESRRYLFEPDPERTTEIRERDSRLCAAVDRLNFNFGKGAIFFAAEGINSQWRPNSDFLSPSYTTDWNALPGAR
ncbi:MAG: Y-family DNA polymerase [Thermoguttaceae bacterium]|nr:Y-family DNA polymerase [Thermoguttaceae bacterium]